MLDQYGEEGDGHECSRAFPQAGKEFVRNLIGALVVYVPIAAFLALWPVAPVGGVLTSVESSCRLWRRSSRW